MVHVIYQHRANRQIFVIKKHSCAVISRSVCFHIINAVKLLFIANIFINKTFGRYLTGKQL